VKPRRSRPGAALALALLLAATGAACGKKGPPQPPPRLIPAQTTDLLVRQTGDRLVLEMSYPGVTTSGLPLSGLEALEVLTLRPPATQVRGPLTNVDQRMFASTATVAARLEGPALLAATRGPRLMVSLDAAPGSPLGAPAGQDAATAAPAPPAVEPPAAEPAQPAAEAAPAEPAAAPPTATPTVTVTPTATPTAAGPPPVLIAIRSFGPRGNESPLSNVISITPLRAPAPPDSLVVTAAAGGVELAWTLPASATATVGFDVLRRRAGESAFEQRVAELGPDRLRHVDGTAVLGERYEYTVRTVAARGPLVESADGPVREIEYRDTFAPPTPTGLVALAEEGRIRLVWERVEAPDLAGYRVHRQAGTDAPVELERDPGPSTDHSDDQVAAGITYTYRVVAVDDDGNESAPSDPATATPR
jgi:hypothetical protein